MRKSNQVDNDPENQFFSYILAAFALLFVLMFVLDAHSVVRTDVAVIHHTASPDWSVDRIRKIHVEENGWDDIGYHWLIRKDGTIEAGRSMDKNGAHAKGRNGFVGIALTGYDEFTAEQIASLKVLLGRLGVGSVQRHHENCPSSGLDVEGLVW